MQPDWFAGLLVASGSGDGRAFSGLVIVAEYVQLLEPLNSGKSLNCSGASCAPDRRCPSGQEHGQAVLDAFDDAQQRNLPSANSG